MKIASSRLKSQTEIIMEAQTKIKIAIKEGFLRGLSKAMTWDRLKWIIWSTVKRLTLKELQEPTRKALIGFCERQYQTLYSALSSQRMSLLAAMYVLNKSGYHNLKLSQNTQALVRKEVVNMETKAMGMPLSKYAKNYIRDNVKPLLERYAKQYALDPGDMSGNNSLRNRAEMEVRYNSHLQSIEQFKAKGAKLVVCSVHADCSNRCFKYQGRVYSLDGTNGVTEDGKAYEPLENATDVYYTTKAGKTYKNGLLGFNCRHKIYEYIPNMKIPYVSKETQEKQYAITEQQREYERRIRAHKDLSVTYKDVDNTNFKKNNLITKQLIHEYKQFCVDNQRAIYEDRYALF